MRKQFSDYKDIHKDRSFIVCGCGRSLSQLQLPSSSVVIGVNDVGRLFQPDYLVVLNPQNQFAGNRFQYVKESRAKAIFSQLNLPLKKAPLVRFKLGQYSGTDWRNSTSLPFTRNSPYVAVCLAAFMGAKKIGLLGVDFDDHHFFAKTGKHPLAHTLAKIDSEYACLAKSLQKHGIELANLSETSRLQKVKKIPIRDFQSHVSNESENDLLGKKITSCVQTRSRSNQRSRMMKIQIEKHQGKIIGGFFDKLAATAKELNYCVQRGLSNQNTSKKVISIVWNGRRYRNNKNMIYCEHGWLPREAYQVSHKGINADSHIAPFEWNQQHLTQCEIRKVSDYIQSLRQQTSFSDEYMQTTAPAVTDLPPEFLLFPLQLEQDTNIVRHVSPQFRRMQQVINYISASNPPYPVIYKQHPADKRRGNRHLQLKVVRKTDQIRKHDLGNIHQLLKNGGCKGIVSLNSNVVHDGFLWQVPAIVLGRNIWPRSGVSPFLNDLPEDWGRLNNFYCDRNITACRDAYMFFLMTHQWSISDAKNQDKVSELLDKKRHEIGERNKLVSLSTHHRVKKAKAKAVVTVNVVAANRGWLFEDLKSHFQNLQLDGIAVISSNRAIDNADVWIYLRAHEANQSPDKSRTLVQIHDQFDQGLYRQGGNRHVIKFCRAVCLTNPEQQSIIEASGINFTDKKLLLRPVGALNDFRLRQKQPEKFTLGWIGRPVDYLGEDFKRSHWLASSLKDNSFKKQISVVLIGDRLDKTNQSLLSLGIDSHYFPRTQFGYHKYTAYYQNIDCVLITSKLAAGPNCLFESLACGIPVVATRCGWVEKLVVDGVNGIIVDSPQAMSVAVESIYQNRDEWFSRREAIRASVCEFSLNSWLEENIQLAVSLKFQQRIESEVKATG
jgi:glycosyltransferase involved in cell wall biosynthesis